MQQRFKALCLSTAFSLTNKQTNSTLLPVTLTTQTHLVQAASRLQAPVSDIMLQVMQGELSVLPPTAYGDSRNGCVGEHSTAHAAVSMEQESVSGPQVSHCNLRPTALSQMALLQRIKRPTGMHVGLHA